MLLCSSGSDGRYVLVQASAGDCPRSFLVRILLFRISGEIFKTQCQFILHGWRNGCVLLDFMASYCCAFCSVTGKVPSKIAIATSKTLDDVTATLKALIMSNRRIAFFMTLLEQSCASVYGPRLICVARRKLKLGTNDIKKMYLKTLEDAQKDRSSATAPTCLIHPLMLLLQDKLDMCS